MRQILRVEVDAVPLIGTCHWPADDMLGTAATGSSPAVLLLNFGQVCRSGPGNISVEMADRLCSEGYPVFRFDLPGLGDTPGDLPEYHETYWRFVEGGGQTPWVCSLLDALKRQYVPAGFVLGGLCGGAITSIFVAERRRADVVGLLLMEPSLRQTPAIGAETMPGTRPAEAGQGPLSRFRVCRNQLERRARLWVRGIRCLDPLRRTYQFAERTFWNLYRGPLPAMMNAPLIRCWQRLQASGLPMLVMAARGSDREFVRCVLFPEAERRQMTVVDLDQTNHLFTAGDGKQRAIDEAARWMLRTYPLTADGRRRAGQCDDCSAAASLTGAP